MPCIHKYIHSGVIDFVEERGRWFLKKNPKKTRGVKSNGGCLARNERLAGRLC